MLLLAATVSIDSFAWRPQLLESRHGSMKLPAKISDDLAPPKTAVLPSQAWRTTLSRMFLYSACLGPLLDNYHGLFNVLTYREGVPIILQMQGHTFLKTALWVPPLFGFAGVAMSAIVLVLDERLPSSPVALNPSWSKVLYGISFFSAQYYLSGLLDFVSIENLTIHVILAVLAVAGWVVFDFTTAGLLLGIATAIAGPIAEIIITDLGLYSYTHADLLQVCSWIPWVYFLGAPAVGNLARRVFRDASGNRNATIDI